MSRRSIFWVLMLLWLVFGFWSSYSTFRGPEPNYAFVGGNLLSFILFALLGWASYGPPIQG